MGKHSSVRVVSFLGILAASIVSGAAACGGGGNSGDDDDGGGGASGQGGASGFAGNPFGGASGFPGSQGAGGSGQSQALIVEPAKVTLTAKGTPLSQAFTAKLRDGGMPVGVNWSVDDVSLGLVGQDGVFTSKGFSGGKTLVTATYAGRKGTAEVEIKVDIVSNPDGVTPDDQGKLQTGDSKGEKISFLYPYDATVFPRGVGAPTVQLKGAKASAMRLLVETEGYRYEGFSKSALAVNQILLPDTVWQGLIASAQPGASIKVTSTTLAAGKASAPVSETWSIAPGSLKGIVYYNTYQSPKANNSGAVMKIKPGGEAEVLEKGCTVCHSVSSQGNRLVAGVDWFDESDEVPEPGEVPSNPRDSSIFELKADGTSQRIREEGDGRRYSFGALSPDGKFLFTNGVLNGQGVDLRGLSATAGQPSPSRLINADTGAVINAPSLGALGISYAVTPAFSHDGKFIAFSRRDGANVGRRTLSVMNFDSAASPPTFSNLVDYVQLSGTGNDAVAGWPSFLPDSKAVVFHAGTYYDTGGADQQNAKARLRLVELATKRVVTLNALNGQKPDGSSYLPLGDAEGNMNYEPTVLPVPVGGYYWVFFTSRRTYGNTIAPGGLEPRGDDIYGYRDDDNREHPSPRKKLWVAAIDLDYAEKLAADPNYDPSHPAFYVTGQEQSAGNMRAFAALEPCRQQGSSCESSTECCDGRSCRQNGVGPDGQPLLQCVDPPPNECAREDDSCTTAADCCGADAGILCINNRCARKPPVIR